MKRLLAIALVMSALAAGTLGADAPAKRNAPCGAKRACDAALSCMPVVGGQRCVIPCNRSRAISCPTDERCVKDGPSDVCRPINDGLDP